MSSRPKWLSWWWLGSLWFGGGVCAGFVIRGLILIGPEMNRPSWILSASAMAATFWIVGFGAGEWRMRSKGDRELDAMLERGEKHVAILQELQAAYHAALRGDPTLLQIQPKDRRH